MLIYIFLLLLVFLLLLPTILISIVRSILSIFGLNFTRRKAHKDNYKKNDTQYTSYETGNQNTKKRPRKKIFDKDDGEYVDFEEIK